MSIRMTWCVLACVAIAGAHSPATAAVESKGRGISGPDVVRILQDEGYRAQLDKDGEGDPMVRTGLAGLNTIVYFYDCEDGRCGSLKLSVGIDLEEGSSHAVLNRFAREYRYVRTFLDDDQDPFLELDFEVLHADHAPHVASQVAMFEQLLDAFARAIGFRGAPGSSADAPAPVPPTLAVRGAAGRVAHQH